MKDVQDKLAVWAVLFRRCDEVQRRLDTANAPSSGIDPAPIEAELEALRMKTDFAFNAASDALHRRPAAERAEWVVSSGESLI